MKCPICKLDLVEVEGAGHICYACWFKDCMDFIEEKGLTKEFQHWKYETFKQNEKEIIRTMAKSNIEDLVQLASESYDRYLTIKERK